ncbi:MAG: hypothetical protein UV34_C0008G0001 [Parcubacteria group bacterium GW2011_GWB1_42_6]|nr:MAG: hypothetical protein UV34_C0008G0001 [Parcubacteria group bacterium GW2011_GWB1_42_6]
MPQENGVAFSLEDQETLAKLVLAAYQRRNEFTASFGGFDNFAEVWQYVDDNRATYDLLEQAGKKAWENFDRNVPDKLVLVEHIAGKGDFDLAESVARISGLKWTRPKPKKKKRFLIF